MSLCGVRVLTSNLIIVLPPHAVMPSPWPWCCQCPGGVPLRSPHHGYPHSTALAPAAHCLWTPVAPPQLAPDASAPAFLPCYPHQGLARRLQAGSPAEHCHRPVLGSSDVPTCSQARALQTNHGKYSIIKAHIVMCQIARGILTLVALALHLLLKDCLSLYRIEGIT
jgi:hypothetical protein